MISIPAVSSGQILLVIAPQAACETMLELSARLACQGPVCVLDGGNQFNAYPVARAICRHTAGLDAALRRLAVARVFTCYQMESLLLEARPQAAPTLLLDFLATFSDENVPFTRRRRLLAACLRQLRRLSSAGPVVVAARPAGIDCTEQAQLLAMLLAGADQVSSWQPPELPAGQPQLF